MYAVVYFLINPFYIDISCQFMRRLKKPLQRALFFNPYSIYESYTLVWITEKTLVPSNFLLLLKLIFLGSWMFECNETYVD